MKILLSGGTVVSMDPAVADLDRGDVLIQDGVIVEVAERIHASDAEVIDASDRIVMPGLEATPIGTGGAHWQTGQAQVP
jgi:cytosine/adenosine deaminase-related metal-dependent hydrolase